MAEVILTPISPSVEKSSILAVNANFRPSGQASSNSDLPARMSGSSFRTLFTLVLMGRLSYGPA